MAARATGKRSSRAKLLRAAATLMRESGYAAVTSRRLAAKAGLKPQLVHYYFRTMDDLFLALFREQSAGLLEKQNKILNAKKPLREMWKVIADPKATVLNYEFVALANHRKALRTEVTQFMDRFRLGQINIMGQILAKKGPKALPWSPAFASVLLASLARGLALEGALDVTAGRAETLATIDEILKQFDE